MQLLLHGQWGQLDEVQKVQFVPMKALSDAFSAQPSRGWLGARWKAEAFEHLEWDGDIQQGRGPAVSATGLATAGLPGRKGAFRRRKIVGSHDPES